MNLGRGMGRLLLVGMLLAAIVAYFAFDLGRFLSFDALNANKIRLQQAVAEAPLPSVLAFGLTYVAVTALSLPVATALSLLAGALFGRLLGTAIVDLSATAGATLAFLSARYLLRDWVESRMAAAPDPSWDPEGARARRTRRRRAAWQAVSAGIRSHGFNTLLALRLIPAAPFFLINLVSGLTAIPTRTFVLGTLIGILPGTFLYVNAGTALGTLTRPADLLSVQVLGALALLALFSLIPVAWRRWRKA
jgi:uncharacterized membrane protein YdjX (TVP38/TMEM64 family)